MGKIDKNAGAIGKKIFIYLHMSKKSSNFAA